MDVWQCDSEKEAQTQAINAFLYGLKDPDVAFSVKDKEPQSMDHAP